APWIVRYREQTDVEGSNILDFGLCTPRKRFVRHIVQREVLGAHEPEVNLIMLRDRSQGLANHAQVACRGVTAGPANADPPAGHSPPPAGHSPVGSEIPKHAAIDDAWDLPDIAVVAAGICDVM